MLTQPLADCIVTAFVGILSRVGKTKVLLKKSHDPDSTQKWIKPFFGGIIITNVKLRTLKRLLMIKNNCFRSVLAFLIFR